MSATYPKATMYFREVRSHPSGAKNIYISTHPTSSAAEHNLTFALCPDDAWHTQNNLCKAKFGVDPIQESQTNIFKRDLKLTLEDPSMFEFVQDLEEQAVKMATERSAEIFGKECQEVVVRDKLKSILKAGVVGRDNNVFKPLIKTKLVLNDPDGSNKMTTKVFVAEHVTPPCDECPSGKISLKEVSDPVSVITKNSLVMAKVRIGNVWKSPLGFGLSCMATHLIVWPAESVEKNPQGAFNFGNAVVQMKNDVPMFDDTDMQF